MAIRYDADDQGGYEAECRGCDVFTSVDDVCLCADCAAKLDRDMIRQRAWEYSMTAFGVPAERYEELREATISKYGADLELIAPENPRPTTRRARRRRGRR